jgi:DNA replication protein DnaC
MSRRQEYLDKLARYDLLIIDDLTVERATDYVTEIAQEVIDARYRTKRPMIITTNADISVQDSVSIERQRMFRRIKDRCHMVEIHDRLSAIRINAEPEDKLKRRALLGL